MTPRPILSVLNAQIRSYQSLSLRTHLLPQNFPASPLLSSKVLARSQASGSQHRYIHSAVTFDASTSHFPTHSELHRDNQPSNKLIRHIRWWEHQSRLDGKRCPPRWTPKERDVVKAACIEFQLKYKPNKERREERLREILTAGRKAWKQIRRVSSIRCAVENDRKHDDLCMGAMGYKTSWPTMNG